MALGSAIIVAWCGVLTCYRPGMSDEAADAPGVTLAAGDLGSGTDPINPMDPVARQAWRQEVFAEYRAAAIEAYSDPAFAQEMREWDEADDGIGFDADR